MGTKYPGVSVSGFAASPPPDDGSQTGSNLITFAGLKTKLGDPLNTAIAAINTAIVAALNTSVRSISAADSTVAGDHMRTVEIASTVSNTVTVSLGDAATMTTTYLVAVRNSSTISQVISRATAADKIDGVAGNITIPSKATIFFTANSVPDGYLTIGKTGPFIDSDPLVVGGTDGTKKVRLEVDGLTAGATRVVTVPDRDLTIGPVLATEVASTSGTTIDFTGIPSGTKRITIMFKGVSTNGSSNYLIQLGGGSNENSGYLGTGVALSAGPTITSSNYTAGFGFPISTAGAVTHGSITLNLERASTFMWIANGQLGFSDQAATVLTSGSKATAAELDRVRITTVNGTDAFDAGLINISYE